MENLDILKKFLLGKGINDLVLIENEVEDSIIKFANNKIVKTETNSTTYVDIFAEKDRRLISTTIKDFSEKSIKDTSNKIAEFLKAASPNKNYRRLPEDKFKYKEIPESFDKRVENLNEVDIVESAINAALKNAKRTAGTFNKTIGKVRIQTSTGINQKDKFTALYFSIRAFREKEESGHKTASSRILSKFKAEKAAKEAGEIAYLAKSPIEGKKGTYNIIFSPLAFAPILNSIGNATSIFSVEAGTSFLSKEKNMGKFTLIDDGTLPNGLNSSKFDDEGHPTQRNIIIQNGDLRTYLHNTSSADRYDTKSTGNAGIIAPEPTNLIFEGKTGNPFDIKKGIYVTNIWYTRFQNYATGDFSTMPRDGMFIVKNGKIDQSIKNLRISDNILNLLKNIEVFGKEKEQITSWEANTPSIITPILVKNVKLTRAVS